jgi:hypothetical protein
VSSGRTAADEGALVGVSGTPIGTLSWGALGRGASPAEFATASATATGVYMVWMAAIATSKKECAGLALKLPFN